MQRKREKKKVEKQEKQQNTNGTNKNEWHEWGLSKQPVLWLWFLQPRLAGGMQRHELEPKMALQILL